MKVYVTAHIEEVGAHRLASNGVEAEVVATGGQTVTYRCQYHMYTIYTCVDRLLQTDKLYVPEICHVKR